MRKTFPINAMIEGRTVLVVGGGRVGQRKVELLLDAGACVVLICPDCVAELTELATAGRIVYAARPFQPEDVQDKSLVFACTDDKHVNRAILECAQAARIPCCCADGNWADGDFVTPAIIRTGEVLIAVSTSGKSCRQSRLIKDNLRKHLDSIESSDLVVLGTSHDYLDSEARAAFHLLPPFRQAMGEMIRQVWGVHEFLILNTCNRIEIVAAVSREASTCGILRRLLRLDMLSADQYYMKHGFEAFSHLCRVTAGMDSQTPGEVHVVSQLKEAVDEAVENGWAGSIIRELCDAALHVSKDIRREVEPLLNVAEIEEVALRYLDQKCAAESVAVIGTGMVGQGLIAGLLRRNKKCVWVYYRNAPTLSSESARHIEVVQLDELTTQLQQVDAVISAVNAPQPVITCKKHGEYLNPKGVCLMDLGMPRNIDPDFDRLGGTVQSANLDDLKLWARIQNGAHERANETVEQVTDDHREFYERLRASIQGI